MVGSGGVLSGGCSVTDVGVASGVDTAVSVYISGWAAASLEDV